MGTFPDALSQFAQLMQHQDDAIDLTEAPLTIACTEYPRLDIAAQLARLKDIASKTPADPAYPAHVNIQALNMTLFLATTCTSTLASSERI